MGSRSVILPFWSKSFAPFTIGSILPAGTGGTQVADTFSLADTFKYALSQIAYVFGINAETGTSQWLSMGAESPGHKGLVLWRMPASRLLFWHLW